MPPHPAPLHPEITRHAKPHTTRPSPTTHPRGLHRCRAPRPRAATILQLLQLLRVRPVGVHPAGRRRGRPAGGAGAAAAPRRAGGAGIFHHQLLFLLLFLIAAA